MAVEYIINEEKRTVVAMLKGTELDAHKAIMRQVGDAEESFFGFNSNWTTLIPDSFTGKAKCDPRDELVLTRERKSQKLVVWKSITGRKTRQLKRGIRMLV